MAKEIRTNKFKKKVNKADKIEGDIQDNAKVIEEMANDVDWETVGKAIAIVVLFVSVSLFILLTAIRLPFIIF
jgi:hypothetical protein